MSSIVTDDQRQQLEQALTASLVLIFQGAYNQALEQMGTAERQVTVPTPVRDRIAAFVRERAALVQTGVNQRIEAASTSTDGTSPTAATAQAQSEIRHYNADTLVPFLVSWASHQGLIDAYRDQGKTDETLWQWTQTKIWSDECEAADAASPAPYDDLMAIAGGPPPRHVRCGCLLAPAG